jgi:hypothetical protein
MWPWRLASLALLAAGWMALAADPALRLHYDFAAPAGETLPDASGHGHTATVEGKDGALPVSVQTAYGQALRLEADKGQGLRVKPAADLVGAEALTVMAWIRPEIVDSHLAIVANKGDQVPGQPAKGYRMSVTWGRLAAELGFGDDEVGVRLQSPEWSIDPQHWAHVALTFDRQDLVLYINATEAARLHLPAPRRLVAGPSAGGLTLGKYYWNDAYPFVGLLADVRIYDRALSAADVFVAASEFLRATPGQP